jgi:hypothetical protein
VTIDAHQRDASAVWPESQVPQSPEMG